MNSKKFNKELNSIKKHQKKSEMKNTITVLKNITGGSTAD